MPSKFISIRTAFWKNSEAQERERQELTLRLEYKRVYNRLKTRRARGKLSTEDWNATVALALWYKDKAEAGGNSDFELNEIYDKM